MSQLPTHVLTPNANGIARIGVVSDSHIPDRMNSLPRNLFAALEGVSLLLHAGDICNPQVLDSLRQIAPVLAVQGNRDVLYAANWALPLARVIEVGAVRIGLTHGHGGLRGYLKEKLYYYTVGYELERFIENVTTPFSQVQAVVFGHSHRPVNQLREGVLLFNPGALGPDYYTPHGPTAGILTVAGERVTGQIVPVG